MHPILIAATFVTTLASGGAALAQVPPAYAPPLYRPGAQAISQHQYQMDQQRYRMDQLRYEADRRQALADQMALEASIRRQSIEAARAPEPLPGVATRRLYAPEVEAGLARGATTRREVVVSGVTQIDSWLDRAPD